MATPRLRGTGVNPVGNIVMITLDDFTVEFHEENLRVSLAGGFVGCNTIARFVRSSDGMEFWLSQVSAVVNAFHMAEPTVMGDTWQADVYVRDYRGELVAKAGPFTRVVVNP